MTDRELLQQALDAWFREGGINYYDFTFYMEALRDQLAQPELEPVAYIDVETRNLSWAKPTRWETPTVVKMDKVPLYTAPPKKEWVGLTDEEIMDACSAVWASHPIEVGRVVEAKLREKNG